MLSSVDGPALTLCHKRDDFKKKLLNVKYVFFSLYKVRLKCFLFEEEMSEI